MAGLLNSWLWLLLMISGLKMTLHPCWLHNLCCWLVLLKQLEIVGVGVLLVLLLVLTELLLHQPPCRCNQQEPVLWAGLSSPWHMPSTVWICGRCTAGVVVAQMGAAAMRGAVEGQWSAEFSPGDLHVIMVYKYTTQDQLPYCITTPMVELPWRRTWHMATVLRVHRVLHNLQFLPDSGVHDVHDN